MSTWKSGNPWKLTTFVLAGAILALAVAGALFAYSSRPQVAGETTALAPIGETAGPVAASPPPTEVGPAPTVPPTPAARPVAGSKQAGSEAVQPSAETRPAPRDIGACNRYAAAARANRTADTVKDALVGGALGAALGAAGGAIAGHGDGAGKGAAIGGIVGVAGGTLYGINAANQADARAEAAYRSCMERRGYARASF